jgi:hypothetical protein
MSTLVLVNQVIRLQLQFPRTINPLPVVSRAVPLHFLLFSLLELISVQIIHLVDQSLDILFHEVNSWTVDNVVSVSFT